MAVEKVDESVTRMVVVKVGMLANSLVVYLGPLLVGTLVDLKAELMVAKKAAMLADLTAGMLVPSKVVMKDTKMASLKVALKEIVLVEQLDGAKVARMVVLMVLRREYM
jgi:hypothetical protein